MKYLILLISAILLVSCTKKYDNEYREISEDQTELFKSVCIDNVKYWMRNAGYKGYLAVRIDPKTLKPINCK